MEERSRNDSFSKIHFNTLNNYANQRKIGQESDFDYDAFRFLVLVFRKLMSHVSTSFPKNCSIENCKFSSSQ